MIISLNTLRKFVDMTNIDLNVFYNDFASAVGEIEKKHDLKNKYKGIVLAEVKDKKKHPNSDKLWVYMIDIGNEIVQVCAGAGNLEISDKVAYIYPGNKTPVNPYPNKEHITIESKKISGEISNGMMLSRKELGLGSDHTKIMILNSNEKSGTEITKVLDYDDLLIEVENKTFTHRPDCFGYIGLSREISSLFSLDKLKYKHYHDIDEIQIGNETTFDIEVKNPINKIYVPRYSAISMKNVKIKESPIWLQAFLSKHNIEPINNIVDITNYVMLITGQPIHAFDRNKIGKKIIVRMARQGEKIHTLDNKVHELDNEIVVISDENSAIAIGGVIGGIESAIDENTNEIIIESATFDLYNIRRTSMKLGLFTDAVTRFGKGQDPHQTIKALEIASNMIKELAEGYVSSDIKDYYPYPRKVYKIETTFEYLYTRIGVNEKILSKDRIVDILNRLEVETNCDEKILNSTVPTCRYDLKNKEDILEEIVRIYGYNRLKPEVPIQLSIPAKLLYFRKVKNIIRSTLKEIGGNELMTYSFVGKKLYSDVRMDIGNCYRIQNSLSPDLEYMRNSILPSLLEKTKMNSNRQKRDEFLLYEIDKVHIKNELNKEEKVPIEFNELVGVYYKEEQNDETLYYNSKLYLEEIFKAMRIDISKIDYVLLKNYNKDCNKIISSNFNTFDSERSAVIEYTDDMNNNKKTCIGVLGDINKIVLDNMKIKGKSSAFILWMDEIKDYMMYESFYIEPPVGNFIIEDWCFVMDINVPYKQLLNVIKSNDKNQLISSIETIDIYQDDKIPKSAKNQDQKQITLRLYFNTQETKDVSNLRAEVEKKAKQTLDANIKTI